MFAAATARGDFERAETWLSVFFAAAAEFGAFRREADCAP
jgi:hypothetical protein